VAGLTYAHLPSAFRRATSNLGPGFDCLGVAHAHLTTASRLGAVRRVSIFIRKLFPRRRIDFSRQGASTRVSFFLFNFGTNRVALAWVAAQRFVLRLAGTEPAQGSPADRLTIFRLMRPNWKTSDNAAPAIFGGFTVVGSGRARDPESSPGGRVVDWDFGAARHPYRSALPSLAATAFRLFVPELEIEPREREMFCLRKIPHAAAVEKLCECVRTCSGFRITGLPKIAQCFLPIIFTSRFAQD